MDIKETVTWAISAVIISIVLSFTLIKGCSIVEERTKIQSQQNAIVGKACVESKGVWDGYRCIRTITP